MPYICNIKIPKEFKRTVLFGIYVFQVLVIYGYEEDKFRDVQNSSIQYLEEG